MAIDTLNRRAATSQFGMWDAIAPTPDGSLDVDTDRSQCNWMYSGIVPEGDRPTYYRIRSTDITFRRSDQEDSAPYRRPNASTQTYKRT